MDSEEEILGNKVREAWRPSNWSAAHNSPPGICSMEVIMHTHRNRGRCWCTTMHEPLILVCSGRYFLQRLLKKWEICIRAGFFNRTTALSLSLSKSPNSLHHSSRLADRAIDG
ncbi:hypothetical protein TNCV_3968871 [Trichonephila clavipes]|nr:hypothetical protein TNCV_3968871 [Trichonephila clavipes]